MKKEIPKITKSIFTRSRTKYSKEQHKAQIAHIYVKDSNEMPQYLIEMKRFELVKTNNNGCVKLRKKTFKLSK